MTHEPFFRNNPDSPVAVLMIHGIVGTPRHFDWMIPHIPESCHISNILLPGHGGSVQDFSNATMEKWQECVEQAITSLEAPGRKIIIVAHSLGTLLAMNAALTHESICGMLLLNVPFIPRMRFRLIGRSLRTALGKPNMDDPAEALYFRACGTKTEPYLWKYLGWIPNFLSLLRLCKTSRCIPDKLSIPCYTYIGGEDDLVHPRSEKWLSNCPHITMRYFPEGSHFGYSPQEQAQIIDDLSKLI